MPLRKFRLKSERVLKDLDSSDEDEEDKELFDEFDLVDRKEVEKIEDFLKEFNTPEILKEEQKNITDDKSELLFAKEKDPEEVEENGQPKSLEDFDILQVIDKGSFGKVFLVINKLNNKYYAMKRIRKGNSTNI